MAISERELQRMLAHRDGNMRRRARRQIIRHEVAVPEILEVRAIAAPVVTVDVPIRIRSEANSRGHWAQKQRRFKKQRHDVHYAVLQHKLALTLLARCAKVLVTLTHHGSQLLDDDNLAGGFKAVRDEVAALLGINDGNTKRLRFQYRQQQSGDTYSVNVRIEAVAEWP